MIYAIAALLACQWLGEFIIGLTGLPIPGALLGMLLLLLFLILHGKVPDALSSTAGTLLQHMMLLFIPTIVGVMALFEQVAKEWVPFVVACIVGTAVTLGVTATVLRWLMGVQSTDRRDQS